MSAIWARAGANWALLQPVGFPDEAALHSLVADAPQVLPLSGSPQLVVLGREVRIGTGSADLLAVEPGGRLVIIEVKLARNAEARRAVVAQILAYAAFLRGTTRTDFEEGLRPQLQANGFAGLLDAVEQTVQDGSVEAESFIDGVERSLASGVFRLVLVLDQAPSELVRLVGYLESIAPNLTIDLITVSRYEVDGSPVLVPQRVDPERDEVTSAPTVRHARKTSYTRDGGADFLEALEGAPEPTRTRARRLYDWAKGLEADGLATLWGSHGQSYVTLLPYPVGYEAGLVTLVNDGTIWAWRSVFEKRAPHSIAAVEAALGGPLRTGGTVNDVTDAVLLALRRAYEEAKAVAGQLTASS